MSLGSGCRTWYSWAFGHDSILKPLSRQLHDEQGYFLSWAASALVRVYGHRLHYSSFWGLPYRILTIKLISHKKRTTMEPNGPGVLGALGVLRLRTIRAAWSATNTSPPRKPGPFSPKAPNLRDTRRDPLERGPLILKKPIYNSSIPLIS